MASEKVEREAEKGSELMSASPSSGQEDHKVLQHQIQESFLVWEDQAVEEGEEDAVEGEEIVTVPTKFDILPLKVVFEPFDRGRDYLVDLFMGVGEEIENVAMQATNLEDIALDKQHACLVGNSRRDEYGIYKFYKLIEDDSRVHNYMDPQPEINVKMWAILIDWLIEVHRRIELMPEILYLTRNLIDGCLSMKVVSRQRLALDLSCRGKEGKYAIVTDRWQKFNGVYLVGKILEFLASYADEFLLHDVGF
ncbi:cyclin-B2-2-like [Juglans regia]|uniref:B-like cyclin n=1 Tax=Juglans regia TaxID=51240 RepID=A0A6P9ECM4_JUGRE|nr:cyclin-B2-2-like [Juglans regia]